MDKSLTRHILIINIHDDLTKKRFLNSAQQKEIKTRTEEESYVAIK